MAGDFGAIAKRTVVSEVMRRLRDLIASGNYRPGDKIPTENELSRRFEVGRSTVREAIKVFEHLGVLEAKAAKGTFVRDRANISSEAIAWAVLLGNDDLQDVFELRELIESAGFDRLVRGVAAGDAVARSRLDRLAGIVKKIEEAAVRRDLDALIEGDYAFHGEILAASGNRLFEEVYETLHAFMRLEIQESYRSIGDYREVAQDHAEILASIREQSPEAAIRRHRQHFDRIRRLLAEQMPAER